MSELPCKVAREGQVNQELKRAEEACNHLETQVDLLETQLTLVLQNSAPLPEAKPKAETPLVPLARRIEEHHKCLSYQTIRLSEIMERLEIR